MQHQPVSSVIQGVGHYVPEKIITNQDLEKIMDTSDTWIRERTGIEQRHQVEDGECTSNLGLYAAQKAMADAGWKAEDLDLILAATLSPDYYFPGIGVQIQNKLGAKTIPALDIRGQCSGFTWCLSTADAFVRSGQYKKILVVGAEIHSRMIEYSLRGRDISVLFGDAAGAVCIEAVPGAEPAQAHNKVRGIIDNCMGSDGGGLENLYVKRPGHNGPKEFLTEEELKAKVWLPHMEGRQVFKHAVSRMLESCNTLLERNQLSKEDIDLLLPHQANLRINEMVRSKIGLNPEQTFNNIQKFGNTTAATLPLLMSETKEKGLLTEGKMVLTVAFGAGFTWGANLIRW